MTTDRHDEHVWRSGIRPDNGWIVGRHWNEPPRTRHHAPGFFTRVLRWLWSHC